MSEFTERLVDDGLPTPPSTTDYLEFNALHRPTTTALINNGLHVTYAEFYRDVMRFTRAVQDLQLPRGSSVAIESDNFYLHWSLLLACENLGLATASFLSGEPQNSQLLAYVDLVLCRSDISASSARRIHRLSDAWLDQVQTQPAAVDAAPRRLMGLGEIQRIKRSSGTTGFPKMMTTPRRTFENSLQCYLMLNQFTRDTRLLIATHFTVNSMYLRATACLRLGATCIFDSRLSLAQAIVAYKPTHVRLFQYQIKPILDELPPSFSKPQRLIALMGAGPLSDELRQLILARFATEIIYAYNNNETSVIALIDADGFATVRPGSDVEIVNEVGVSVPFGQTGQVRIRSNSLSSYIGDAAKLQFRDGWFYTGDAGIMVRPRQFKIVGRIDEVLNIGGMKMSPLYVEEDITKNSPVATAEIGVTSIGNRDGVEEICIAAVAAAGTDVKRLEEWLIARYWLGKVHFAVVDRIPHTETGKVQRHLLKAMFENQGSKTSSLG